MWQASIRYVVRPWRFKQAASKQLVIYAGCVDANGFAYTWGYGSYWQLGTGKTLDAGLPQKVQPKYEHLFALMSPCVKVSCVQTLAVIHRMQGMTGIALHSCHLKLQADLVNCNGC